MATERQILANRANAKKSTGPRTAAGRLRSSRNALRHGLSLPLKLDSKRCATAEWLAQRLLEDHDQAHPLAATEVAQAQLDLLRICTIRNKMMANLDMAAANLDQLRRLKALDRYEGIALAKRRRAFRDIGV